MSFLDVAENYDIFLDHACGGVCACTTCHLHVKEGAEGISEAEDLELDRHGDGGGYPAELAAGLPGGDREAGRVCGRDSEVEPELRAGRQAGAWAGKLGFGGSRFEVRGSRFGGTVPALAIGALSHILAPLPPLRYLKYPI